MTTPALVKAAELKRMADVAKSKGVTVWIEINGRRVGVSPDIQSAISEKPVDMKPEDFSSLAEWQAWRDRERAREAQRDS
ncbi:hypothetical protein J2Z31_004618 [Sinorhizobium kostiense]|uniref:Uncharacterized protein n=1 Tax=Sinorhizobium kostiense TaxID=76747 RepID=A0ABS4R6S8_9HYPH|nr:hypothetical protein [Sinorhizobium kostiense]MBP2238091.1 hypothetical protein [Sinorhizobium kostiense]